MPFCFVYVTNRRYTTMVTSGNGELTCIHDRHGCLHCNTGNRYCTKKLFSRLCQCLYSVWPGGSAASSSCRVPLYIDGSDKCFSQRSLYRNAYAFLCMIHSTLSSSHWLLSHVVVITRFSCSSLSELSASKNGSSGAFPGIATPDRDTSTSFV